MSEWVELGATLSNNEYMNESAKGLAHELIRRLGDSVIRPSLATDFEDYCIFCLEPPEAAELDKVIAFEGQSIAQIVNTERFTLHPEVVRATVEGRISWYNDDAAFVDWPAAVLFGTKSERSRELTASTVAALEFINVQLLQFEILSKQLDKTILRAYQIPETGISEEEQNMLDELTMDCLELFGRVGSGLKMFSNTHLARLFKAISKKFEFQDRTNEIRHKLADLRDIKESVAEKTRHRQSHLVEILIAGLIIIELFPMVFDLWAKIIEYWIPS